MAGVYRLFFRKDTGSLVYRYSMFGDVVVPTIDQDFKALAPLQGYLPESIQVVEVPESDVETLDKLRRCRAVSLDVGTMQLVFDFAPEQQEQVDFQTTSELRIADLEAAVAALLGGVA